MWTLAVRWRPEAAVDLAKTGWRCVLGIDIIGSPPKRKAEEKRTAAGHFSRMRAAVGELLRQITLATDRLS
jgi:hypothetical protein